MFLIEVFVNNSLVLFSMYLIERKKLKVYVLKYIKKICLSLNNRLYLCIYKILVVI